MMDRGEFPHLTDAQFESVRKMVGIFGGDALRSLAAATPAEQVERIDAFDTYKRGLIAHGKNLHFWVREVELAMDAAPISTSARFHPVQPRRSGEDVGVHARSDNAGLFHNLGSA
ncbi:Gag protein, partial [Phytophthora palmivora]